ncbi:MAG: HIT domain-containing protein [Candidatus Marinimicrobia bacterium]|nr:HIT domain-containing protein [Candidatus Neomarinimicrobiota bacterium]
MNFKKLKQFLTKDMRMSHVYQPVMIRNLLKNKGKADSAKIAKDLLAYDVSQVEYYQLITKNMVGKVLTNNRGITYKDGDVYQLNGFDNLSAEEQKELISICEEKIDAYIEKRGKNIWQHRRVSSRAIPGSVRYEVLKRAKGRCELCGISKDVKSLEVDHIIPRSKQGKDELSNYQALCYTCNAQKLNRDDTDFRNLKDAFNYREKDCIFCNLPKSRVIDEDDFMMVVKDNYPVTKHHTLFIPKRHVEDYFGLFQPELNSLNKFIMLYKEKIMSKDKLVTGFNIGMNNGEDAGQTIFHCHIHLIPRRKGDIKNPRGGVRGVIPNKKDY